MPPIARHNQHPHPGQMRGHQRRLGVVLPLLVLLLTVLMYVTLHAMSLNAAAAMHALSLASSRPAHWPAAGAAAAGSAGSGAAGDTAQQPGGSAAASMAAGADLRADISAPAARHVPGTEQHRGNTSGGQLRIPRLLHQNYLGGAPALVREALQPRAHFRRDWWRSCQTHNPGWAYMLWDLAACEALLAERYPWFLQTWRALPSLVLRSDAIRPFILHAHGGVYIDLDTECFRPLEASLVGAGVVLQSEDVQLVNNAQMASVPGAPLWADMMAAVAARARQGITDPLHATGPHLLTHVLRAYINKRSGPLPGEYAAAGGVAVRVYGPGHWFTPCAWDDWGCHVRVARSKPDMRRQRELVGVHHFSGSWLGLDGSRSLSLMNEAQHAAADFLLAGGGRFEEARCAEARWLPRGSGPAAAAGGGSGAAGPGAISNATGPGWPVCWELVQPAARAGRCTVLSVVQPGSSSNSSEGSPAAGPRLAPQDLELEVALAAAGCRVHLVTPLELAVPADGGPASLPARLSVHHAALGLVDDPLGPLPSYSLPWLLARHVPEAATASGGDLPPASAAANSSAAAAAASAAAVQDPAAGLVVVRLSCGACAWPALNQLHLQGSLALQRVGLLLLEVAPPAAGTSHQVYAAYQHLYQEVGMLGYSHRALPGGGARLALMRHQWQPGE